MLEHAETLVNQMNQRSYDGACGREPFCRRGAEGSRCRRRRTAGLSERVWFDRSQRRGAIETESDRGAFGPAGAGSGDYRPAQRTAIAPTSPTLAALRAQAQSYRDQIEKRRLEITGASGTEADKLEKYDQLTTRAQLAATRLAFAQNERDQARQDVERQHLFIQVIARPNLSRITPAIRAPYWICSCCSAYPYWLFTHCVRSLKRGQTITHSLRRTGRAAASPSPKRAGRGAPNSGSSSRRSTPSSIRPPRRSGSKRSARRSRRSVARCFPRCARARSTPNRPASCATRSSGCDGRSRTFRIIT